MPKLAPRSFALLAALLFSTAIRAADVTVQLSPGDHFIIRDGSGTIDRLRIDEATGNVSRNGALFVHTTGLESLFIGPDAASLASSGSWNVAIGVRALAANTTGFANSALGRFALLNNNAGFSNSAVGVNALLSNTSGGFNTAMGESALSSNTTGYFNTAFGSKASFFGTTASFNAAFGSAALQGATTGSYNSAFGTYAMRFNDIGARNAAFGYAALRGNVIGNDNAAFGRSALFSNSSGARNIAVGANAGSNQTTGSDNIYLANQGAAAENGQIKIGTAGTHSQTHIAGIHGATSGGGIAVLVNASGKLGTTTSSARFKQDVRNMGGDSDVLMRLRPVTFRYREDAVGADDAKTTQYGLIAEEVAEVAPELVAPDAEGRPYSVKYHELPALLLNELQDQERLIAEQRAVIAALVERVQRLEER